MSPEIYKVGQDMDNELTDGIETSRRISMIRQTNNEGCFSSESMTIFDAGRMSVIYDQ